MLVFITILKIVIHQWKWVRWRETDISTGKYISLTETNLAMAAEETKRLVEIPAFATINLQLDPLADPLYIHYMPATIWDIGVR